MLSAQPIEQSFLAQMQACHIYGFWVQL